MPKHRADMAIIGAGIVGLAHAYAAARRGQKVVLFERQEHAVGASIRNFGLIWPVGLACTPLYESALYSSATWRTLAAKAGFWCADNGVLFLAHHADEEAVLHEFVAQATGPYTMLSAADAAPQSPGVQPAGLRCGLRCGTELTIDPRQAIRTIPTWLRQTYDVALRFATPINGISFPRIETMTETWQVQHVVVCSGPDFQTLYPATFAQSGLRKCKLQMLRTAPQPQGWQLGPTLCAGLTMARYENFAACASLPALRQRLQRTWPEQVQWGIHVMLAQNSAGELLIGDTHEYGLTFDPFVSERASQSVLDYLATFARFPRLDIAARWYGVYTTLPGQHAFIAQPEPGVTIVQNTNGLGMTLAFGLAEKTVERL